MQNLIASPTCVDYMKMKETCAEWNEPLGVFLPYPDAGGCSTIGWGHKLTHVDIQTGVFQHGLSQGGCDRLFVQDLRPVEQFILRKAANYNVFLTQGMFDALVDLGYNAGFGAADAVLFAFSSNQPVEPVFRRFVHDSKGNTLAGLVSRREWDIETWNS